MFDPQLLKSFVAVAESGGFTRAAAGLRALGKEDKVPPLPEVDYVMETCRDDTRQVVKAFADYGRFSATRAPLLAGCTV